MFMNKKSARLTMAIGGLLLLSACTRSVSDVDSQGKTATPVFPDPAHAVRTEGSFVNVDNLKQVRPGMTKAQVYELIGVPHFDEGVLRVKEWDYIFHFTKTDKTVMTCQYKVLFDSDMLAQSFYFQPENCLSQLNVSQAKAVHKELSAAGLFAFGSSVLTAKGEAQIKLLATELKAEPQNGQRIVVTGHTDRLGRADANQTLSQNRANAVKNLLVANGISAADIETRGMGASEPMVFCPGTQSAKVIACLAPNRRMAVDVLPANAQ